MSNKRKIERLLAEHGDFENLSIRLNDLNGELMSRQATKTQTMTLEIIAIHSWLLLKKKSYN